MSRVATFLTVAGVVATSFGGAVSPDQAAIECAPEVIYLPALAGHEGTTLTAMNARGWAVGSSAGLASTTQNYRTAVLWRDGEAIELGIGGGPAAVGIVDSYAVDVNENGVVVAQRVRQGGRTLTASSWLWHDGEKTRFSGSTARPFVFVEAVNDRDIAVGVIASSPRGESPRPALWRNPKRPVRLPIPTGSGGGVASINNHGLIVGNVHHGSELRPWYWRIGGRNGPLPDPSGSSSGVIDVDNRDRVLSRAFHGGRRAMMWRGTSAEPRVFGGYALSNSSDMNDYGDLTGHRGGFRGFGFSAWVSHLGVEKVAKLPEPDGVVSGYVGAAVIRGVTWFAPQGGVSVGGYAVGDSGTRAVIWTCTQTY